ncbi:pentapeptide repeat-containing protein [Halorubrum sp. Ea8]|uniref:pentapeptide repeat-containing protein n=1 Tax=Halorubrum sp. Ea8 TaxID=1383841 RepID=UPI001594ECE6|nr:pentapeptide repeat-containing protein [Halorubrum sp. Ea8]
MNALRQSLVDTEVREQTQPGGELLDGAVLTGIKFDDIFSLRGYYLRDTDFSKTDLSQVSLNNANLTGANLFNADLTNGYLWDVNFTDAYLFNVALTDAYLFNTDFIDADLTSADLRDADLPNTEFTGADLTSSDLSGTDLTDARLRWASLADVTAIRANFTDTDLLGVDLEGASLNDSQFDGAALTGARLYDTKPQGVSINDQTVFSDQTVYAREADPCDPWHPLDGETTTPISLRDKIALAVRSGQVLQSRYRSADANPPSGSIAKVRQAVKRFRRHRNLNTEDRREVGDRLKKATSVYRIRQRLQRENSRPRDVAQPYVREQHSRRKRAFATRSYWEWFKHATYRWVMLYGESPARVVGTSIAAVAVFAAIYSIVGGIVIGGETPDLIGYIYFSAVTFSTLGYGGIEPTTTTTQLLASVQSLIGGILIALLVAVFGRRALR